MFQSEGSYSEVGADVGREDTSLERSLRDEDKESDEWRVRSCWVCSGISSSSRWSSTQYRGRTNASLILGITAKSMIWSGVQSLKWSGSDALVCCRSYHSAGHM